MKTTCSRLLLTAVILAVCHAARADSQYLEQLNRVMASLPGQTVGEFLRRNPQLYAVGGFDLGHEREFIFENEPVMVTTTLPPYVPAPRRYNDSGLGRAFDNLNAAINTAPGVSRSTMLTCRITITAEPIASAPTADSWRIVRAYAQGRNC